MAVVLLSFRSVPFSIISISTIFISSTPYYEYPLILLHLQQLELEQHKGVGNDAGKHLKI